MRVRGLGNHARHAFTAVCRYLAVPALTCLTGVRHFNVPDIGRIGGVLIAANHQSYLDPVLVAMALDRPIHYMARQGLFHVPGLGQLVRLLGARPVSRGRVDMAAFRAAVELLSRGKALLVFPEGTRTWNGDLGAFKVGVGAIAIRCGVPVLPVCIEGAFQCWPRTRRFPMPAMVAVAYDEPLWPRNRDGHALTRLLAERIRSMQNGLRRYLERAAPEQGERATGGCRRTEAHLVP